jgi:hypothetical protein
MDSFTAFFFSKSEDVSAQTPTDGENGGGSGKGYCVVCREVADWTPVNEENGGGSANGYCVIA